MLNFNFFQKGNSQRTVSTVKKGFEAQVGKRRRAREAAAAAAPRK